MPCDDDLEFAWRPCPEQSGVNFDRVTNRATSSGTVGLGAISCISRRTKRSIPIFDLRCGTAPFVQTIMFSTEISCLYRCHLRRTGNGGGVANGSRLQDLQRQDDPLAGWRLTCRACVCVLALPAILARVSSRVTRNTALGEGQILYLLMTPC